MRSQRSRTFAEPDGTFEVELYPGSIHFKDGRGAWRPIDTTLVDRGDGSLRQAANRFDLVIPAKLTDPVELATGEELLSFTLMGARDGQRASSHASARYADVLEGVDVVYEPHPDGVKETLVLDGPSSPSAVTFAVELSSGLELSPVPDGGAVAVRRDGSTAFYIGAPFAMDADDAIGPASLDISSDDEGVRLTVAADSEWLAAPERSWPVIIDPTVTVGDSEGEVSDCHIASDVSNTCSNSGLFLGHGSPTAGYGRGLIRFDDLTNVVPRDAVVGDADLQLYLESTTDPAVTTDISAHGVTSAWDTTADWTDRTSSATWSSAGGDFDAAPEWTTEDVLAVGWHHWYPGELVESWVKGTRPNDGLLLKTPEDSSIQVLRFTSENSATSWRWPRLVVTYGYEWGNKPWHTTFDQQLTDRSMLSVNIANGNLRLHSLDMKIAGLGLDLSVERSWNSRWAYVGDLGSQWKMHAGSAVNLVQHPTGPAMNAPNGNVAFFTPDGAEFKNDPDLEATLVETSPGDFTLTYHESGEEVDFETPTIGCGLAAHPCAVLVAHRDRDGNEITYTYANTAQPGYAMPYLDYVTDTRGRVVNFVNSTYLTDAIDPTGRDVEWFYTNGRMTTYRDANNQDTTYSYDAAGLLSKIADGDNRQTAFTYDGDGRVLTIKRITNNGAQTGPTWTFAYGSWTCASNQCTAENTVTDPNGGVTTYTVDSIGHATAIEDPLGNTIETTYTDENDVGTAVDPAGGESTIEYNADSVPTSVTDPPSDVGQTPRSETFSYGDQTNNPYLPTSTVNTEGDCTRVEYDAEGHVTDIHEGLTPTGNPLNCDSGTDVDRWEYVYNAAGQVTTATDPEDGVTTYTYDTDAADKGELVTVEHPDDPGQAGVELGDQSFTYDSLSRVATFTDGKGQVTGYTYDGQDRTTRITYNGDSSCASAAMCINYVYDDAGNVTSRSDGTGSTAYAYDSVNRLTAKTLPSGVNACTTGGTAMTYTYDGIGNLKSHCDGAGVVSYGYDLANNNCWLYVGTPAGSPTCASPPSGAVTFEHDSLGRRTETVLPTATAVTEARTYDDAGNLTEIRAVRADSPTPTELTDFDYTYTEPGSSTVDRALRYSSTDTANVTTTYTYDALDRLTGADLPGTSSDQSYTYDDNGNRLSKSVGGSTTNYTYNDANQLTSGATTPTYDDNGNETTGPNGRTTTYSVIDQVASVTPSGGSAIAMSYANNSNGERRTAGARSFADSVNGVARDAKSGDPTVHYIRDAGGSLVARRTSTTTHYYLVDGLGSVIKLIDATGAVTNEYAYDPWGVMTVVAAGAYNPWRFAGGFYDSDTELTKFGARFYDPAIGRWTQLDPSGQDPHYSYAGNSPVSLVDPSGLITYTYWKNIGPQYAYSTSGWYKVAFIGWWGGPHSLEQKRTSWRQRQVRRATSGTRSWYEYRTRLSSQVCGRYVWGWGPLTYHKYIACYTSTSTVY